MTHIPPPGTLSPLDAVASILALRQAGSAYSPLPDVLRTTLDTIHKSLAMKTDQD
jgi:hypothetical protein